MSLQDKYAELLKHAQDKGVQSLSIQEQDGVLYVSGETTMMIKDELWNIYNTIDPEMRSGDLVLNIEIIPGSEVIHEVQKGESLSLIAKKYSNMTWQKIFEANKDILKDPNKIFPGQKLKIPL